MIFFVLFFELNIPFKAIEALNPSHFFKPEWLIYHSTKRQHLFLSGKTLCAYWVLQGHDERAKASS